MAVLATEAFTYSDQSLITANANWALAKGASSNCRVISNQCGVNSASARAGNYYSTVTWPNDQYSQLVCVKVPSDKGGPSVRMITSGAARNEYYGGNDPNDFGGLATLSRITKEVANVVTSLGTGSTTLAAGQTWYLSAVGTTLTMKINGTTEISVTDSSLASGAAGIWLQHNNTTDGLVDTWEGGNFVNAAADTLLLMGVGR